MNNTKYRRLFFWIYCASTVCTLCVLRSMYSSKTELRPQTMSYDTGWPFIDDVTHYSEINTQHSRTKWGSIWDHEKAMEYMSAFVDVRTAWWVNKVIQLSFLVLALRAGIELSSHFPQLRLHDLFTFTVAAALVVLLLRRDFPLSFPFESKYFPERPIRQSSRPLWQNMVAAIYCFFAFYGLVSPILRLPQAIRREFQHTRETMERRF